MLNIPANVRAGEPVRAAHQNMVYDALRKLGAISMTKGGAFQRSRTSGSGYTAPFAVSATFETTTEGTSYATITAAGGIWHGRGAGDNLGISPTGMFPNEMADVFKVPGGSATVDLSNGGTITVFIYAPASDGVITSAPRLYVSQSDVRYRVREYRWRAITIVGVWQVLTLEDGSRVLADAESYPDDTDLPGQVLSSDYWYFPNRSTGGPFAWRRLDGRPYAWTVSAGLVVVRPNSFASQVDGRVLHAVTADNQTGLFPKPLSELYSGAYSGDFPFGETCEGTIRPSAEEQEAFLPWVQHCPGKDFDFSVQEVAQGVVIYLQINGAISETSEGSLPTVSFNWLVSNDRLAQAFSMIAGDTGIDAVPRNSAFQIADRPQGVRLEEYFGDARPNPSESITSENCIVYGRRITSETGYYDFVQTVPMAIVWVNKRTGIPELTPVHTGTITVTPGLRLYLATSEVVERTQTDGYTASGQIADYEAPAGTELVPPVSGPTEAPSAETKASIASAFSNEDEDLAEAAAGV